jgi:hypothetical protein
MSLPRLVEVRITVTNLEGAIAAWRMSSGLEASLDEAAREATIRAGDCLLRLVESAEATTGLAGLKLSIAHLGTMAAALADVLLDGAIASIDPQSSQGVPIQLIEEIS